MGLVVLEGPTGIGKTAVVQGVYEQLAMRQSRPAYWPATIAASGPGTESVITRLARAKQVVPDPCPAPGSAMEFLWWGWTARPGRFAVEEADAQLKYHVQAVAEAVQQGDRLVHDRLALALTAATFLASHGLLGSLVGTVLGGADDLRTVTEMVRSAGELGHSRDELLSRARNRNSGTTFSAAVRADTRATAEKDARWLALTAGLLPFFVVVEDAQYLDQTSIWLLQRLARQPEAKGLIVLTADTDQPMPAEALADWLAAGDRENRLTRIRLAPLAAAELTEIAVAELGKDLDGPALARVVGHAAGVPGALYDLIEAPAVAQMVCQGVDGPEDLGAVSPAEGVRAAFRAAPEPLRQALAAASVHGLLTVRDWLPDQEGTAAAVEGGWLVPRAGTAVIGFASPRLLDVVRAEQIRELAPPSVRALRQGLLDAITRARAGTSWDDLDADVRESLLATVVEEDPEPPADLTAELFDLRRVTGREAADGELLDEITERLASDAPPPRVLVVATAEALFDAGQRDRALTMLSEDLDRLRDEFGRDSPRTWPALHSVAAAYAAAARAESGHAGAAPLYQRALLLYRELLDARAAARPPEPERVIGTRLQYAQLLADCYRYQEAIAQGETLLGELVKARGPDRREPLSLAAAVASWRAQTGDVARAAAAFEQLVREMTRVLGPQDRTTLWTRHQWMSAVGRAGYWDRAAGGLDQLRQEEMLLFGRYDPQTMSTAFALAYTTGNNGDGAGALALYAEVLADRTRVLGPDDPDTLQTRANLAYWRGRAGEYAAAIAEYDKLVADQTRVLGPDDPSTLASRANRAYWRGKAGEHAVGIAEYEQVVAARTRVLGADHPATLKARLYLATLRGEAGDPAAAANALDDLVKDQIRVLGLVHIDTAAGMKEYMRWAKQRLSPGA